MFGKMLAVLLIVFQLLDEFKAIKEMGVSSQTDEMLNGQCKHFCENDKATGNVLYDTTNRNCECFMDDGTTKTFNLKDAKDKTMVSELRTIEHTAKTKEDCTDKHCTELHGQGYTKIDYNPNGDCTCVKSIGGGGFVYDLGGKPITDQVAIPTHHKCIDHCKTKHENQYRNVWFSSNDKECKCFNADKDGTKYDLHGQFKAG